MNQYTFAPRQIPLDSSWDVIVVGGGPSGCTSAAAAAREGAKVLLVEQTGSLGGMGTSALVPAWTPFSDKKDLVYRGLAERVFTTAKQGMAHVKPTDADWVPIDAERLKRVYDDLCTEFGVTVLFNTFFSAVDTDGAGRVTALIFSNKSGMTAKRAKVYVDCTGDADLAAWAGAEFHKGDDSGDPANLMPATHCFILSNVDDYAYRTGPGMHAAATNSPHHQIMKSGKYPVIPDIHCCNNSVGPGSIGFNAGHVYAVDSTDPANVSKALMTGRKIAAAYRDALAEFYPAAFGNAFLAQTGSLLGVRESRRIVGDYVLTLEDYMARRDFDDEIARNSYFIDVHAKVKEAFDDLSKAHKWEGTTFRYGPGESHGIPYRCLTPKGLANVLVAGRSISAEQIVQGSVRVMPCCLAMGEAAGIAAASASKHEVPDVRKVDVQHLRKRLKDEGAYIK
ncbi:MAG TPA: FAD-dependent oxidoreductase [Tepidisphaeraceae bacterium]|nr:FAD-dependent oxidoreductase [Tepidisphaeraceae bacterium]